MNARPASVPEMSRMTHSTSGVCNAAFGGRLRPAWHDQRQSTAYPVRGPVCRRRQKGRIGRCIFAPVQA